LRVTKLATPPFKVSRAVAYLHDGALIVAGGLGANRSSTNAVWRMDLATSTWARTGTLARAAHDAAGAHLHGKDFFFGGGAAATVDTVQALRAKARGTIVAHLPQPRSDVTATMIGARAFLVGGYDGNSALTDVLETADGTTFTTAAHLATGVRYAALATVGSTIYAFGGEATHGPDTDAVQAIDTAHGTVRIVAHTPQPIAHAVAWRRNGVVYLIGGDSARGAIWSFDVARGRFTFVARLPSALRDMAAATDGTTLFLAGGERAGRSARSLLKITVSA